jgi:hypothetical protein
MLERHRYTAQQVSQELKAKDYPGGYNILKRVRALGPAGT